jgi:hypothetical protein
VRIRNRPAAGKLPPGTIRPHGSTAQTRPCHGGVLSPDLPHAMKGTLPFIKNTSASPFVT